MDRWHMTGWIGKFMTSTSTQVHRWMFLFSFWCRWLGVFGSVYTYRDYSPLRSGQKTNHLCLELKTHKRFFSCSPTSKDGQILNSRYNNLELCPVVTWVTFCSSWYVDVLPQFEYPIEVFDSFDKEWIYTMVYNKIECRFSGSISISLFTKFQTSAWKCDFASFPLCSSWQNSWTRRFKSYRQQKFTRMTKGLLGWWLQRLEISQCNA